MPAVPGATFMVIKAKFFFELLVAMLYPITLMVEAGIKYESLPGMVSTVASKINGRLMRAVYRSKWCSGSPMATTLTSLQQGSFANPGGHVILHFSQKVNEHLSITQIISDNRISFFNCKRVQINQFFCLIRQFN